MANAVGANDDETGALPPFGVPAGSKARSIEAAAIAGIAYSVLAITAIVLLNRTPSLSLSDEALTAWFDEVDNRATLILGLNLAALSSIAFLWFVAVIRRRIGNREDRFFATVFFGASIAYVSAWLLAASAIAAPAVASTQLDAATVSPASATLAGGQGAAVLLVIAPRLQAVFVFTTSTIVLRSRVLPTWLAVLGYVFGLILFVTPLVINPLGFAFPVWVFVFSTVLLVVRPTGDL